ncbi:hypothetical protein P7K49_009174 [Saguinus oedipus]|uniref:Uncharacterized protein n=1 Tax=Saguinus oedipus TaxID=9490 RepID=A0ABQ9VJ76_SAGOE|nr:hypothetical protein P7K49_009174 [Saguinus oedipus]
MRGAGEEATALQGGAGERTRRAKDNATTRHRVHPNLKDLAGSPSAPRGLAQRPVWESGLPAVLSLRGLAIIVRDDLRPQGPTLSQPVRLAHGTGSRAPPPPTFTERRRLRLQARPPRRAEMTLAQGANPQRCPAPSGLMGGRFPALLAAKRVRSSLSGARNATPAHAASVSRF